MTEYYFDSSAIIKYYLSEAGSRWIKEQIDAQDSEGHWRHTLAVSRIGLVEVAAAIAKHRRMGDFTGEEQRRIYAAFIQLSRVRLVALKENSCPR